MVKNGGKGVYREGHPSLGYYDSDGASIVPYTRILIRNKRLQDDQDNSGD